MKIRSCASVITLGIGVLRLTTSLVYAGPGDGQDAPAGNAMNPRGVSSTSNATLRGWALARIPGVLRDSSQPARPS